MGYTTCPSTGISRRISSNSTCGENYALRNFVAITDLFLSQQDCSNIFITLCLVRMISRTYTRYVNIHVNLYIYIYIPYVCLGSLCYQNTPQSCHVLTCFAAKIRQEELLIDIGNMDNWIHTATSRSLVGKGRSVQLGQQKRHLGVGGDV